MLSNNRLVIIIKFSSKAREILKHLGIQIKSAISIRNFECHTGIPYSSVTTVLRQ